MVALQRVLLNGYHNQDQQHTHWHEQQIDADWFWLVLMLMLSLLAVTPAWCHQELHTSERTIVPWTVISVTRRSRSDVSESVSHWWLADLTDVTLVSTYRYEKDEEDENDEDLSCDESYLLIKVREVRMWGEKEWWFETFRRWRFFETV